VLFTDWKALEDLTMLKTGDVVSLPGMRSVITAPAANPATDTMEMEITIDPGTVGAPPHFHPRQEEEYRVVRGTLNVLLSDGWRDLAVGESAVIRQGTTHTFRNTSDQPTVLLNIHRPAHGFAAYWEEMAALSRAGKLTSIRDPRSVILLSVLMMDHKQDLVPTGPLGRVVMPVTAWVGRRLGVGRAIAKERVAA
jgi:mannose-6-phosphate isomerase-like protein (cupin superfamily)